MNGYGLNERPVRNSQAGTRPISAAAASNQAAPGSTKGGRQNGSSAAAASAASSASMSLRRRLGREPAQSLAGLSPAWPDGQATARSVEIRSIGPESGWR